MKFFLLFLCSLVFAESDQTEVHLLVCPENINEALKKFQISSSPAEHFDTYYFDTKDLILHNENITFRIQDKLKKKNDFTVKIRPMNTADVSSDWFSIEGFKCEWDQYDNYSKGSCSLKSKMDVKDLKNILSHKKTIYEFLTEDQRRFLETYSAFKPIDGLEIFGNVPVDRWILPSTKSSVPEITLEYWKVSSDFFILELSGRSDPRQSDVFLRTLKNKAKNANVPVCKIQKDKTDLVLEYFVKLKN